MQLELSILLLNNIKSVMSTKKNDQKIFMLAYKYMFLPLRCQVQTYYLVTSSQLIITLEDSEFSRNVDVLMSLALQAGGECI